MKDEIKEILESLDKISKAEYYPEDLLTYKECKLLLDYITNLQEENERLIKLKERYQLEKEVYKSRNEKAAEYITSYEAISTIQGLDKIEQNKKLDKRTMNVMVERYLKVHHNLLNILQGDDKK